MVTSGLVYAGGKELRENWPISGGIEAGTTKHEGTGVLEPEEGSLIPHRLKVGLGDY